MHPTGFHEAITRITAWLLSMALTLSVPGLSGFVALLLTGVTVYFANNFCNALFRRAVSFPITVRPEDVENYELARVHSGAYSIVLWLMLVVGAQWQGMG